MKRSTRRRLGGELHHVYIIAVKSRDLRASNRQATGFYLGQVDVTSLISTVESCEQKTSLSCSLSFKLVLTSFFDVEVTEMKMYKYKEGLRFCKRWPRSTYI